MDLGRNARLGVITGLLIFSIASAVWGLSQAIQEQPNLKWGYMGGALLAFISGSIVAKAAIDYSRLSFQIEIDNEKRRVGRPLSEQEMEQVRAKFKEGRRRGENNIPFPLQRLIAWLFLLLPAIVLVGYVVVVGAFFGGLCVPSFIEEYRRRTFYYL